MVTDSSAHRTLLSPDDVPEVSPGEVHMDLLQSRPVSMASDGYLTLGEQDTRQSLGVFSAPLELEDLMDDDNFHIAEAEKHLDAPPPPLSESVLGVDMSGWPGDDLGVIGEEDEQDPMGLMRYHRPESVFWKEFGEDQVVTSDWKRHPFDTRNLDRRQRTTRKQELARTLCRLCAQGDSSYFPVTRHGHLKCLQVLKMMDKWGAADAPPCDARDSHGATALHLAARSSFVDMVQCMLECGLPADTPAKNGSTPIHDAAAAGCLLSLQCLLFHDASLAHATIGPLGLTPLHLACIYGHSDVVQWLVDRRHAAPPLPAPTARGLCTLRRPMVTPRLCRCSCACSCPSTSMLPTAAAVLHNSGADLRVSAGGLLPIHVAAMNGALSAVQYLLNTERAMLTLKTLDGESPLHLAAGEGHDSVLRVMMALHAHLDATTAAAAWLDPHGATPVHVAAMCGQQASLRVFAECGVDLAARDREGLTPSDLAREAGHTECAIFLTLKGA
eukprot:m.207455 g.207455  ORF g.207455 m.207455 type:complete len:500 (-) comp15543_c0_seq11:65-1564(-)